MRSRICVRNVLLSCVLTVGFVLQAQAEEKATESAATPTSESTTSTTEQAQTTAAVTPETDEAEKARQESVEFERVAKQYQKTEKDGQTLYCRREKTLGTRLAKTVCLTDSQLRARIQTPRKRATEYAPAAKRARACPQPAERNTFPIGKLFLRYRMTAAILCQLGK